MQEAAEPPLYRLFNYNTFFIPLAIRQTYNAWKGILFQALILLMFTHLSSYIRTQQSFMWKFG